MKIKIEKIKDSYIINDKYEIYNNTVYYACCYIPKNKNAGFPFYVLKLAEWLK